MDDTKLQAGFYRLYSLLKVFRNARKDYGETFINELNAINKTEIENQYRFYDIKENKEKIVLTRYRILGLLLKGAITSGDIENIKSEIRDQYDYDIYRNWGNFGILYSIFNFYHEKEIAEFLSSLNETLIHDLGLSGKAKFHMVDFNGAQNNGFDNFWTAIYNNSHKQQKTALHLYISSFSGKGNSLNNLENEVKIGLGKGDENTDDIDFKYVNIPINEISYEKILHEFEEHKIKILNNFSIKDPTVRDLNYWIIAPGENAHKWKEFSENGEIGILWDELGNLGRFHSRQELKDEYKKVYGKEQNNNDLACYEFAHEIKVGDIIIPKKGVRIYLGYGIVESDYIYDENRAEYKSIRKVKWIKVGKWEEKDRKDTTLKQIVSKTLTNITKYTDYGASIIRLIMNDNPMNPTMSLNTILYGVPGTGKTYNTVNYALSIIEQKPVQELLSEDRQELNRRYNEYKEKGQIVFTTFHQSFGYEEFIEGLRANTDDSGNIIYSIENGIFKNLAKKAKENLVSSMHPTQVRKDFHEVLDVALKGVNEGNPLEIQMVQTSFKIYDYNDRTIYFEKALGGRNHTLSIKTLEGMYNTKSNSVIKGGLNVYYAPLLKLCLEKEGEMVSHLQIGQIITSDRAEYTIVKVGNEIIEIQSNKGDDRGRILIPREIVELLVERIQKNEITLEDIKNKPLDGIDTYIQGYRSELKAIVKAQLQSTEAVHEKPRNYVLIIDEINRGNISKVFGELITLIEDTKRIGNREETSVVLPNSQEEFGVPNNLFILGTMNTADRSIALMDIALRRRFTFKEVKPNVDLLAGIWVGKIDIQKMFETLNRRIEYLFDRDHVIGHSFFLPLKTDASLERLNQIFENNIIPLLQEYFYEDWEKIQIIFGDHIEQGLKNERDTIIHSEVSSEVEVLGFNHDDIIDEKSSFRLNENPTENSYIGIYQRVNE